jgi:hypothetical protein
VEKSRPGNNPADLAGADLTFFDKRFSHLLDHLKNVASFFALVLVEGHGVTLLSCLRERRISVDIFSCNGKTQRWQALARLPRKIKWGKSPLCEPHKPGIAIRPESPQTEFLEECHR